MDNENSTFTKEEIKKLRKEILSPFKDMNSLATWIVKGYLWTAVISVGSSLLLLLLILLLLLGVYQAKNLFF